MPLQPSRKDVFYPPPNESNLTRVIAHHGQSLRSRDPGYLEGRFATPQPVGVGPSLLVGGEDGGDSETPAVIGEDGDRLVLTHLGDQVWPLSYDPIAETIHVHFHRGAGTGREWKRGEHYVIDDDSNVIVIYAATLAAAKAQVGDVFSAQYLRLDIDDGPDEIDPALVGSVAGVWDGPTKTLTFTLPAGTAAGDLIVATVRGARAPGGGEVTLDATCSDPRVTVAHKVTGSVVETVFVGIADGSGSPLVVDVIPDPSLTPSAKGALAVWTGVNGFGAVAAVDSGSITPTVSGIAAVAVTWIGGAPFTPVNADPPTGYTDIGDTGTDYSSTSLSWWYDPDATTSPSGTFVGEGCCVIAII